MRDIRFIAEHRGGLLSKHHHRVLADWAAECVAPVLLCFERVSADVRPRAALESARAWSQDGIAAGAAMRAAVGAHAAARQAVDPCAVAVARAAGHAAATAHCADHCLGALLYALKARRLAEGDTGAEMDRLLALLEPALRPAVMAGLEQRLRYFVPAGHRGVRNVRASRGKTTARKAGR